MMNGGGGQDDGHLGTPPPGLFITLILTRLVTRDTLSVETKHFIEEINNKLCMLIRSHASFTQLYKKLHNHWIPSE